MLLAAEDGATISLFARAEAKQTGACTRHELSCRSVAVARDGSLQ